MKPKHKESEPGTGPKTRRPEDLDLAHRVHTLSQLVMRHLVAQSPWCASMPAPACWPTPAFWPLPMSVADPAAGPVPAAWPCCP
jgi:hypothetical protein